MTNVLITGASGQLGKTFIDLQNSFNTLNINGLSHSQFDITKDSDYGYLSELDIDILINCAAYTKVDDAEDQPDLCNRVNIDGAAKLADYCSRHKVGLVHFSSDYVYHNDEKIPFSEESPTEPKSVYARSKLLGEKQIIKVNPTALIFRVSWLYAPFGNNFVNTMIKLCKERPEIRIVHDQLSAPTYCKDLAEAVLDILKRPVLHDTPFSIKPGIYNYANEGVTTPYEMVMTICNQMALSCKLIPISISDYPSKADRPEYSVLNLAKFKQNCNIPIPHWRESLILCLDSLKSN